MHQNSRERGYLTHFPVCSYLEAQILSKDTTWEILEYVKFAGARGTSASEVSKDLSLPPSVVYSTLKELCRLGYIFIYPREKRPRGERKKKYVYEKIVGGKFGINKEFAGALELEGELKLVVETLKEPLLTVLAKVYDDFTYRTELKAFLPAAGEVNFCPRCNLNHNAIEFFYAVILAALDEFMNENDEFRDFLGRLGYASYGK